VKDTERDLKLPVFETPSILPRRLTMLEYLEFVELAYKTLPNKEKLLEQRLREGPRVRFELTRDS
jgi:hypothetical protein